MIYYTTYHLTLIKKPTLNEFNKSSQKIFNYLFVEELFQSEFEKQPPYLTKLHRLYFKLTVIKH
jgi:hypothetical protein